MGTYSSHKQPSAVGIWGNAKVFLAKNYVNVLFRIRRGLFRVKAFKSFIPIHGQILCQIQKNANLPVLVW